MREIFDQYFNTPLQFHLKLNVPFVKNKIKRAKLTKPQMDCLYPKTGTCNKNSKDFDISLLHKLFKTICNLNPPPQIHVGIEEGKLSRVICGTVHV